MLKERWRVSMQSLIMRAADLGCITEHQKKYLFIRMSQLGMKREEPGHVPETPPSLISEVVRFHLDELGYNEAELCGALFATEKDLSQFLLRKPSSHLRLARPPDVRY